MAHTAFTTKPGLYKWLSERGLALSEPLPSKDETFGTVDIAGHYYDNMILEDLPEGLEVKRMSNGAYTRATITRHDDGAMVINYHNPNVQNRITYDYATSNKETA